MQSKNNLNKSKNIKIKEVVTIKVKDLENSEKGELLDSLKHEKTFYTLYNGVKVRSSWSNTLNEFVFCGMDIVQGNKGEDHKASKAYFNHLKVQMERAGHYIFIQERLLASEGGMHLTDCVTRYGWIIMEKYMKCGKNGINKLIALDLDGATASEKKEEVKPVTRDKEDKHIPRHIEEMFSIILNYLNK